MNCSLSLNIRFNLLAFIVLLSAFGQNLNAQGYFLNSPWGTTATDGSGLSRGDAITLTWGIIGDGTAISAASFIPGDSNDPSNLISYLDTKFGDNGGGSDLTNRPWFSSFENSFNRWSEVSGVSFAYEANDNGVDIRSFPDGELGTVADMRIGGHSIDGSSGYLGYNYYPRQGFKHGGDMVIDTDTGSFFNNNQGLRNFLMHEIGHGLGIEHLNSNDAQFLMEPTIRTSFDGPQFSDILAANRLFGDKLEKSGGNDSSATASNLSFSGGNASVGNDATDLVVLGSDVDFVSIDGSDDTDYFSFVIDSNSEVQLELTPLGPTYNAKETSESSYSSFDASAQNDLVLTLYDTDGTTILESSNISGLGGMEAISRILSAGTYYAQVSGTQDTAQFYSLDISQVTAVPEPRTLAMGIFLSGVCLYTVRRKKSPKSAKS